MQDLGYVRLLRSNRNYRNLWYAQIGSLLGDWFSLIASASLVSTLTESSFAVGGLFAIRMLAPFVISPVAGIIIDRWNRRTVLLMADVVRAVIVLGFLLVDDAGDVWLVYVLTATLISIGGTFIPARNALLPDIVPSASLGAANAISVATWSVMLALGAALGGLTSGLWGWEAAFIIDAVTYVVSAGFILRVQYTPIVREAVESTIGAALRQYVDGLRIMWADRDILVVSLHKGSSSFVGLAMLMVTQVRIAEDVFPIGVGAALSMGALYTFNGIGAAIGTVFSHRLAGHHPLRRRWVILAGYVTTIAGLIIVASLHSLPVVLAGTLVRAVGGGAIWALSTEFLLRRVPEAVRGRVLSNEYAFFYLAAGMSSAIVGTLLDTPLGISGTILAAAATACLPALLWLFWVRRHGAAGGDPEVVEFQHAG